MASLSKNTPSPAAKILESHVAPQDLLGALATIAASQIEGKLSEDKRQLLPLNDILESQKRNFFSATIAQHILANPLHQTILKFLIAENPDSFVRSSKVLGEIFRHLSSARAESEYVFGATYNSTGIVAPEFLRYAESLSADQIRKLRDQPLQSLIEGLTSVSSPALTLSGFQRELLPVAPFRSSLHQSELYAGISRVKRLLIAAHQYQIPITDPVVRLALGNELLPRCKSLLRAEIAHMVKHVSDEVSSPSFLSSSDSPSSLQQNIERTVGWLTPLRMVGAVEAAEHQLKNLELAIFKQHTGELALAFRKLTSISSGKFYAHTKTSFPDANPPLAETVSHDLVRHIIGEAIAGAHTSSLSPTGRSDALIALSAKVHVGFSALLTENDQRYSPKALFNLARNALLPHIDKVFPASPPIASPTQLRKLDHGYVEFICDLDRQHFLFLVSGIIDRHKDHPTAGLSRPQRKVLETFREILKFSARLPFESSEVSA